MAKFRIPVTEAENPAGSGDLPFPVGTWKGVIEEIRIAEVVAGSDEGPQFLFSDGGRTALVASIQLGSISPFIEGQPDVGERKFFDDLFLLRFDDFAWDEPQAGEPTWRLEQTRRRLTNLALALNAVDGDEGGVGPVDSFGDMIINKELEGMEVMFEVAHRKGTSKKTGEKTVYPFIKTYLPVV